MLMVSSLSLYSLFAVVLVRFTASQFTGSETSQSATVSLELAPGSAVVPGSGLTVSLTTSSTGGTATG